MSEPFSPLDYMKKLYEDLSSTLPWPEFDHPHLPPCYETGKMVINGKTFLIFEAYDEENAYSNYCYMPTPCNGHVYATAEHYKLAKEAEVRGGGPEARAAVAATKTVDEAEDVVDEVELIPRRHVHFLHHCPLRDVLFNSGEAEIVACGNDEEDRDTCGIPYRSFGDLESVPSFPSENRLGKALMVVREFFKTIDEEDLVVTRRDCFFENDGGEENYMRKRGLW